MAILKVKDENGNIIPIPAIKGDKGEKGDPGKDGIDGKDGVSPTIDYSAIMNMVYPVGSYCRLADHLTPHDLFGGLWMDTEDKSIPNSKCYRRFAEVITGLTTLNNFSGPTVIAENKSLLSGEKYFIRFDIDYYHEGTLYSVKDEVGSYYTASTINSFSGDGEVIGFIPSGKSLHIEIYQKDNDVKAYIGLATDGAPTTIEVHKAHFIVLR